MDQAEVTGGRPGSGRFGLGVFLLAGLLVAGTAAPTPWSGRPDGAHSHSPKALVAFENPAFTSEPPMQGWLTTPDQTQFATPVPPAAFSDTPAPGGLALPINPTRRYQPIVGFGAALTDSSAILLESLLPAVRNVTLRSLFAPGSGAGISVLRIAMGASDFAPAPYTYDDLAPGASDPALADFSIGHDEAAILPVLRQALSINPHLVILATPWSAPAWMKTERSLEGGTLNPADYAVYGQYFVRFIEAYAAAGIPVSAVSAQNEPENAAGDYPSMTLTSDQEATFVGENLGPALVNAGLSSVKILGYDHNWSDTAYPISLLRSQAAVYLYGTAFHCYAGAPGAQAAVHVAAPRKAIWFTECSGGSWSPDFATNLGWDSANLLIATMANSAETVLFWNVALDPSGGPHDGGCSGCRGVVTVHRNGTVTENVEFAELAEASSAVQTGAVRVATPPTAEGVESVAFVNPDGTRAIIIDNSWGTARVVNVSDGSGATVSTALPGGATLSLRWSD